MPTFISHSITAAALNNAMFPLRRDRGILLMSVISSIIPDIDVLAFIFGIPYNHALGHRGFSHSLAFAALWSLLISMPFANGKVFPGRYVFS